MRPWVISRNPRRFVFFVMAFATLLVAQVIPVPAQEGELDVLLQDDEEKEPKSDRSDTNAVESVSTAPTRKEANERDAAREGPRVIDEIVVTAQKVEQSLFDVPIAVSVLDDDFIAQQSITDFRDVSFHVPNVSIDTARQLIDVRIRGFGSPVFNKGFEQPVGLVIDGISYSRRPYWLGPIFDVERVEVLRGPQGTLFGKNTTAGLVNVVTKKPTDGFTGYVDVELGELDHRRFEAAIGGPVVPGLVNFRISGLTDERDGFMQNTTAAVFPEATERMLGRSRQGFRAQLAFPDLLGTRFNLSFEHVDLALLGSGGTELSIVEDSYLELAREYDPNTDAEPRNFRGSHDFVGGLDTRVETLVAHASSALGRWELDGLFGYSFLDNTTRGHVDQSPAPAANSFSVDDNPQTTTELRLASPDLDGLFGLDTLFGFPLGLGSDFVGGFFYQNRRVDDSGLRVFVNIAVTEQMAATDATGVLQPCPGCENEANEEEGSVFWDQTLDSVAGFGQLTWTLTDALSLQYGMRFTQEWKEADWRVVFRDGPTDGATTRALFSGRDFTEHLSQTEFAFTPKVALKYAWTDDLRTYASWGRGFKAGGFNETVFNNERAEEALQYDSEQMAMWEVGTKTKLFGGAANVEVALFRMKASDLQVFTTQPTGIGGTTLLFTVNAGKAISQGAELDFTWLPTEWMTLRGGLGFDDTEFIEFPFGSCAPDRRNTDGDDDPRCDLSGEPLFFTPKWTSTLTGTVTWPLSAVPGIEALRLPLGATSLFGSLTLEYKDTHFTSFDLDPRGRQGSFFRLGGNLGFRNSGQGWSLKLVGENLNDVYVTKFFTGDNIAPGNFAVTPAAPRLFFGTFRWEF